jgi:hypothetical protein
MCSQSKEVTLDMCAPSPLCVPPHLMQMITPRLMQALSNVEYEKPMQQPSDTEIEHITLG